MTKLSDLDMTVRTYNALKRAGFETLEDVAEKTEEEIMALRGVSRRVIGEIKCLLDNEGMEFEQ